MTISSKQVKGGTGQSANAEKRDSSAKPKFSLFRTLYRLFKYGTIFAVVLTIVLGGVLILGEIGEQIGQQKSLETLFKSSPHVTEAVDGITKLLNSKKSSFISNKAINMYLEEKPIKNNDQNELQDRFTDLDYFVDHFLSQRYEDETVMKFPLDLYGKNYLQVVDEPLTAKTLGLLKGKVQSILEKNSLEKSDSTKQLKWSRIKKLIDGGKFDEILELIQENVVNWVWQWIGKPAKVFVLMVDESKVSKSTTQNIQKNKKFLKKWIQQHEDEHEIIIISKFSINSLYDSEKEDTFKSFEVKVELKKFEDEAICKFLNEHQELNEKQCNLLREKFDSLYGLYEFVDNDDETDGETSWQLSLPDKAKEVNKVLQKVCQKGQTKYYFYENQENSNKVLTRNKKTKKSRLDRELDALLVKFSEMKYALGLNRITDVYNTFFSVDEDNDRLTLREANSMGLLYDFEEHVLRWKNDIQKVEYEVRMERSCDKQGSALQDEDKEEKEAEKTQKDENEQEQAITEEDEQQVTEQEEQLQEEYEQNPIHYNDDDEQEQADETNDTEQDTVIIEDEQVIEEDEETEEVEETTEQNTEKQDENTENDEEEQQTVTQQSQEEEEEQANINGEEQANTQQQTKEQDEQANVEEDQEHKANTEEQEQTNTEQSNAQNEEDQQIQEEKQNSPGQQTEGTEEQSATQTQQSQEKLQDQQSSIEPENTSEQQDQNHQEEQDETNTSESTDSEEHSPADQSTVDIQQTIQQPVKTAEQVELNQQTLIRD